MRVSTLSTDRGYSKLTPYMKVFFNGTEVSYVFTADEEKRLIVQAVLDEDGKMQIAPCKTKVLTEVRYGDVYIDTSRVPKGAEI